jgi:hypothetical protein
MPQTLFQPMHLVFVVAVGLLMLFVVAGAAAVYLALGKLPGRQRSLAARLQRALELKERGLIDDEEYGLTRQRLLAEI